MGKKHEDVVWFMKFLEPFIDLLILLKAWLIAGSLGCEKRGPARGFDLGRDFASQRIAMHCTWIHTCLLFEPQIKLMIECESFYFENFELGK